jgi:hypothetical protein
MMCHAICYHSLQLAHMQAIKGNSISFLVNLLRLEATQRGHYISSSYIYNIYIERASGGGGLNVSAL